LATEYLDRDDAFDAYAEAVEVSVEQAPLALLNEHQLESALARPQNAAAYEDADIVRQAATLFWGIASNHAFQDGNKRVAVVMLRAFLQLEWLRPRSLRRRTVRFGARCRGRTHQRG
jgi:death-on-curing family protein